MGMRYILLALFLLCTRPLWAQAPTPSAAILFVQADGQWDTAAQTQWEPLALPPLGPSFEPSTALFASLSPTDRSALLTYPDILIASSRAPTLLKVQYLVLAHISGDRRHRLEADLVDIPNNERYHLAGYEAGRNDQLMSHLAETVHKRINRVTERSTGAVLGNTESKMYHLPNVEHTDRTKLVPFKDEREARQAGYRPCPICFPEESKAPKEDDDEGSLGQIMSQLMRFEYPITRYVDEAGAESIAQRLMEANHLGGDTLRFKTINTDDIFSVSYTGGEVYFSSGLQKILETPDETAALIAHELAHVQLNHFLIIFREAYDEYGPPSIVRFEHANAYAEFLLRLHRRLMHDGFPQPMEQAADGYAVLYLIRAGYKADVYAQTLHKIQEAAEAHHFRKSAWTRVHPMPAERVARLATLPDQIRAVLDVSKSVAEFDPGAASAIQNHAVEMAAALPVAKQFATLLQANEGTAPYSSVRGEPEPRN